MQFVNVTTITPLKPLRQWPSIEKDELNLSGRAETRKMEEPSPRVEPDPWIRNPLAVETIGATLISLTP